MKLILIVFSILSFAVCACGEQSPRKATLAQQKMCYEQAEKVVEDMAMDGWSMDWVSHYNVKTNICYVRALEVKIEKAGNALVEIIVKDAFENDDVGLFFSREKDGLTKVTECRVEGDKCTTEDEFNRRTRSIWQD